MMNDIALPVTEPKVEAKVEAKPKTNGASKVKVVSAVKKTPEKKAPEVVTLKDICAELKIDPSEARAKLRAAGKKLKHAPKSAWEWSRGSPVIKEIKAIIKVD